MNSLIICLSLLITAAPGRVELVLNYDRGAPISAGQNWARELAEAKVYKVRVVQNRQKDFKPRFEQRGTASRPTWIVHALIDSRGDIRLPSARFRQGDARSLAAWINDIARKGPPESREPTDAPFGLTVTDFTQVFADLERPAPTFETGIDRGTAIHTVIDRLAIPIVIDRAILDSLGADKIEERIPELSLGTTLAYLLRPVGLGFVPVRVDDGKGDDRLEYQVKNISEKNGPLWPIGHKSKQRRPLLAPALYKSYQVNIQDVPAIRVFRAVADRTKLPLLIDRADLAREKIDLDKINVRFPPGRMSYNQLLQKTTTATHTSFRLLVDEAGHPFLYLESF
jgi:hypothetical protein